MTEWRMSVRRARVMRCDGDENTHFTASASAPACGTQQSTAQSAPFAGRCAHKIEPSPSSVPFSGVPEVFERPGGRGSLSLTADKRRRRSYRPATEVK